MNLYIKGNRQMADSEMRYKSYDLLWKDSMTQDAPPAGNSVETDSKRYQQAAPLKEKP